MGHAHCQRTGKVIYTDKREAQAERGKLRERARMSEFSIYRCDACHGWHIGSAQFRNGKIGKPEIKRAAR